MAERRVVGPGFHAKVYALVRKVPRGRVTTYGQIATLLGSPRVARQVGWAMAAALPEAAEPVPWHRVINAKGGISSRGDVMRAQEQRERLEAEGVQFGADGTVDLDRYRWHFPGHAFPDEPLDPDAFTAPRRR
jgi:methylated-DNA-protein-cysteine methyltransferase-like protein